MKIERFKKKKNGIYEISLSDGRIIELYEEIILKYDLLIKKNIDDNILESIINDNKYYEFYYIALKFIKVRRRSVKEVSDKLTNIGCSSNIRFDILNKLIFQNYLNDSEYTSCFVNNQIITTNRGPLKIKSELLKKGIEESIIDDALIQYDSNIQREKLNKIIGRLIRNNKTRSNHALKRKIFNDLLLLGFTAEDISSVYDNFTITSDEDIKKKEYDKIYNKLSRKYSGKELDLKVKEKMFQKGFYN